MNVIVPQQPPDGLIITGVVLQINRCRGMPKLVDCDPKTDCFLNALRDLFAELAPIPGFTVLAGKQPRGIRSPKQGRSKLVDVFVNKIGQWLVELEVQGDVVLHVIIWEYQPVRRVEAAGLDEGFRRARCG